MMWLIQSLYFKDLTKIKNLCPKFPLKWGFFGRDFRMKLRFHLENNIMKIKFKNENYLEPIKSTDIKRSYRADKLKEFYLKYPDVFLENYFVIELLEYQKLFIRLIVRDTDK